MIHCILLTLSYSNSSKLIWILNFDEYRINKLILDCILLKSYSNSSKLMIILDFD